MNKLRQFLYRNASALTTLALAITMTTGFGGHCRTWFYQPKVPQR